MICWALAAKANASIAIAETEFVIFMNRSPSWYPPILVRQVTHNNMRHPQRSIQLLPGARYYC
jgi:hypothetical protein